MAVLFIWPGILMMTLVIAVILSVTITSRKVLDERPVRWATQWVLAWTPFAAVLFLVLLLLT